MAERWLDELAAELRELQRRALRRTLVPIEQPGRLVRVDGRELVNLASNDYLGLAGHAKLKVAAVEAVQRYGTGAGASRLVCGHLDLHERVERRFAAFKHAEAALLLPTGYMANLAVMTTLARRGDLICIDKLTHASLIDACRASEATMRVVPHLDAAKLERLLSRHAAKHADARRFIVTDSVFSMDGDAADLTTLCELATQYDAITVVDEAHATGVLGETGAGLCELQGIADHVDVVVSTASKALGGLGGIVTAKRVVIETLVNRARPFVYTTAVPPAQAAAIDAALDVVRDEPWRRQRLGEMSRRVREALRETPFGELAGGADAQVLTPIVPLVTGSAESALALADHLRDRGFLAVAIRPPTVPLDSSRVRLSLRADLTDDDISRLIDAIGAYNAASKE